VASRLMTVVAVVSELDVVTDWLPPSGL